MTDVLHQNRRKKRPCALVCVTDQFSCERLVNAGAEIARQKSIELQVMSVMGMQPDGRNAEALDHLFNVARSFGAEMTVFYDREPSKNFIKYVKRFQTVDIVAGVSDVQNSPFYLTIKKYNERRPKHKMLLHIVAKNGDVTSYDAAEQLL